MRLSEIIHLVMINISQNKFKVMLTSLGIIVGSATIVLVIAIGQGGREDVADQFKNLNAGAIDISAEQAQTGMFGMMGGMPPMMGGMPGGGGNRSGGGMPGGGGSRSGGGMRMGGSANSTRLRRDSQLSASDVEDLTEYIPELAYASLVSTGEKSVLAGDLEEEETYTVAAVEASYPNISNLTLDYGSFFTEEDDENGEKYAVIGASLAEELFYWGAYAVGELITIEGKKYEIVGVLSSMGSVSSGISPDSAIYVPYTTGAKYVFGNENDPKISCVASNVDEVEYCITSIESVLTQNHANAQFTITDAGSAMQAAQQSANTLSMLLIAVASIVFIVGGIGIMNVLFVSVQERTKEIGILKAIGCSKRVILLEFLIESNAISTMGGVIGVILSYGLVPVVRAFGMTVSPTAAGGALALVFAIVTGTVFGFYPAQKAASLVPIEALSAE